MVAHRLVVPCVAVFVTRIYASPFVYDEETARNFASLSSVTYCADMTNVLDWTCGACKESKTPLVPGKIKVIDAGHNHSTRVIVGKLSGQNGCLVAFRGTDNSQNWARNFQVWDKNANAKWLPWQLRPNCLGCEVHSGFYEVWNNMYDKVVAALNEIGCSPASNNVNNLLYVTGHSMGAAVAHLAMFTLKNAGFSIAKAYTFEAPRIGNKAFSDAFSEQFAGVCPVFRITHHKDPVVHLPLLSMGFVHVQQEIYYDSAGKYTTCSNVEDSACSNWYWDVPGMLLFDMGDHCASSLVQNGDLCNPGCASSEVVVV